ncbi:MAG: hypothetical protein JOZ87_15175 [Chloroflexi bacterium]|nr:hypothetical protein [Chloroflexota bacterium]
MFHGAALNTELRLGQVLEPIAQWANQPGHDREIVILSVLADPTTNAASWQATCQAFLSDAGNRLLQPNMLPSGTNLYDVTMNELWALPNQPTIIADFSDGNGHNWSSCTRDQSWPAPPTGETTSPIAGFYANQCGANPYGATEPFLPGVSILVPGIIGILPGGLSQRLSAKDNPRNNLNLPWPFTGMPGPYPELPDKTVGGLYSLGTPATPALGCLATTALSGLESSAFGNAETATLAAVKGWYTDDDFSAQANMNIISGDFIQDRGIVEVAIGLDKLQVGPRLDAPSDKPGQITCTTPESSSLQMRAYPAEQGPGGPVVQTWQGISLGNLDVSRAQLPPGNYDVRVDCTTTRGLTSSLRVPTSALGPVPLFISDKGSWDGASELLWCTTDNPHQVLTLNVYPTTEGPQGQHHRSGGSGPYSMPKDVVWTMNVRRSDFPPGDYQLTVTCASNDSPPQTATPLTFSTSQLPSDSQAATTNATPGSAAAGGTPTPSTAPPTVRPTIATTPTMPATSTPTPQAR